jgi:hypothetical protein
MLPKRRINKKTDKKGTFLSYNKIPFLDRPLQSILRFMQENRATNEQSRTSVNIEKASAPLANIEKASAPIEQDLEIDMFYCVKNKYPFDSLSKIQMEVYGHTFSTESNAEAILNFHPPIIINDEVKSANYEIEEQQKTYAMPIGPMSFLCSTIPHAPNPTFVNFLQACSK